MTLKNLLGRYGASIVLVLLAIQLIFTVALIVRESENKKELEELKQRVITLEHRSR